MQHHLAVGDDGGEIALMHVAGLPDRAVVGIELHRLPAPAVEALVLEKNHGVVILVGGQQGVEGVLRGGGIERLQAGEGEEGRFQFLGMEGPEGEAAAAGEAQHQRHLAAGAEMVGGGVEDDLGGGVRGEIGELEFLDRAVGIGGQSDGVACAG